MNYINSPVKAQKNHVLYHELYYFIISINYQMNDQEEQIIAHFKGNYKSINLDLELLAEDHSLLIIMVNTETLECFEAKISSAFFQENKEIAYIFESPVELMKFLVLHFGDVILTKLGEIKFDIQMSSSMKAKTITIKTQKKEMDKFEFINLKVENLKQRFQKSLNKKQQQIEELKENNIVLMSTLRLQKQMLDSVCPFTIGHCDNPHNSCFTTSFMEDSIIVDHTAETGWYNFILNKEIVVGSRAAYKVKLLKMKDKSTMFLGFGSRQVFGVSDGSQSNLMAYRCSGILYEGGKNIKIDIPFEEGDIARCEVNLVQNIAKWIKNGILIYEIQIPQQLQHKSLYFVMHCSQKNDKIQIMLD